MASMASMAGNFQTEILNQKILNMHVLALQDNTYLFRQIVDVCFYVFVLEYPGCPQGMGERSEHTSTLSV